MTKKYFLVFTTINVPNIAKDYCENFEKFGHKNEVAIIIIGDKKSPDAESFIISEKLRQKGFDVQYFDIKGQEEWLKKFPKLKEIIPYNSDNRRNIGYLMAKERGCRVLISVDDDNFPIQEIDFIAGHSIIGEDKNIEVVKTDSGWFNICDLLEKNPDYKIYPRGYPYDKRWKQDRTLKEKKEVKIMLNQGLWLHDPDVDSITRINNDIKIKKFLGGQIALEFDCWSPINTQNTALDIMLLPAYYFVLMGEVVDGLVIDRYGDIWSGFFTKKVLDAFGGYASFGEPVANHIRNKHDLFKDLKQELGCIIYTEKLINALEKIKLTGKDISDLYLDLCDKLLESILDNPEFSDEFRNYFKKLNYNQKIWLDTIKQIEEKALYQE